MARELSEDVFRNACDVVAHSDEAAAHHLLGDRTDSLVEHFGAVSGEAPQEIDELVLAYLAVATETAVHWYNKSPIESKAA